MSPHHHPHLLPLLLAVSTILPFSHAGAGMSPGNFNQMCIDQHAEEFPESHVILANLDYYDMNMGTGLNLVGWTRFNDGTCDNSIRVCSDDTDASNNSAALRNINVVFDGPPGDPVYLETNFTCSSCDEGCMLNVTVETDNDMESSSESFTYNCSSDENEVLQEYETNTRFDLRYSVTFSGTSERQCVRINRYRVYYYRGCPAIVFNLTNLTSTDSGILNTSGQCVDNSESSSRVAFGCSMSEWVLASAAMCECSAGFEPNANLTACTECAAGHIKSNVSNDQCEMCTGDNQVSNPERTECICAEKFIGADCDNCETDYFISGSACVMCPAGSTRDSDSSSKNSCSCDDGLVTAAGSDTTNGENCDKCAGGYFRTASGCESCPEGSNRMFGQDEGYCSCNEGLVTSEGSIITDSTSVTCIGIVVKFSPTTYTFKEEQPITVNIIAVPPPLVPISITLSSAYDVINIINDSLTISKSNPEVSSQIRPINDDIGLQDPRTYTVKFDTESVVDKTMNTANISIEDNDEVIASFEQTSYTLKEGDGKGAITVILSRKAAVNVVVRVVGIMVPSTEVTGLSAPSLNNISKTLTFIPGDTEEEVTFDIINDSEDGEDDEQYRLTLMADRPSESPGRFSIGTRQTLVYIKDDDEEPSASLPLGAIIGACAGGALLAVILALICLFCLCIWRLNVKRQGFYNTYEDTQTSPPRMLRYSASLRSISSQSVVPVEGKNTAQKENEFFV